MMIVGYLTSSGKLNAQLRRQLVNKPVYLLDRQTDQDLQPARFQSNDPQKGLIRTQYSEQSLILLLSASQLRPNISIIK